jgi:hypothetical protein
MAATFRATILLSYKSGFVPSDLGTVKLKQDFQGGSSKDKMCPIFNGDPGIKAFLAVVYVEQSFQKIAIACTLQWTTHRTQII